MIFMKIMVNVIYNFINLKELINPSDFLVFFMLFYLNFSIVEIKKCDCMYFYFIVHSVTINNIQLEFFIIPFEHKKH